MPEVQEKLAAGVRRERCCLALINHYAGGEGQMNF